MRTQCTANCSKTKPTEEGVGDEWGLWPRVFTLLCSQSAKFLNFFLIPSKWGVDMWKHVMSSVDFTFLFNREILEIVWFNSVWIVLKAPPLLDERGYHLHDPFLLVVFIPELFSESLGREAWKLVESLLRPRRRVQTALTRCPVSPLPLQTWMFLSGLDVCAPRLSVATKSQRDPRTSRLFCAVHDCLKGFTFFLSSYLFIILDLMFECV